MARGIRVQEIYGPTLQGEGPHSGLPTSFIRLAGCNFRCPGWGVKTTLPNGKEVEGCDTPRAVFPELYNGSASRWMQPSEIVDSLPEWPKRVCLTGGEPLFQPMVKDLVNELINRVFQVDIFTNGSIDIYEALGEVVRWGPITFTMDWKLPGSGEFGKFNEHNFYNLTHKDAVKFVIKDRNDFDTAVQLSNHVRKLYNTKVQFFAGVVFGVLSNDELQQWIIDEELDWTFQLQQHKYSDLAKKELERRVVDIDIKKVRTQSEM